MILVIGKARMTLRPIKLSTQQTKEPSQTPREFHAQQKAVLIPMLGLMGILQIRRLMYLQTMKQQTLAG